MKTPVPLIAHKDPALPAPVAIPDGPQWAGALRHLDVDLAETLCAAVRTLYPHDALPIRVYHRVVAALDAAAGTSPTVTALLAECARRLDADFPVAFRERSESYRVGALKAIEGSPAFRYLQRSVVRHLYDDIEVWQAFGYEGASHHLGGYVDRGFDDLDWLPPVPSSAHR